VRLSPKEFHVLGYAIFGAIGALVLAMTALFGIWTILLILLSIALCSLGMVISPNPVFFVLIALGIIIWVKVMWDSSKDNSNDRS
jgi:predicted ABC-type sugar transport system permease subunit